MQHAIETEFERLIEIERKERDDQFCNDSPNQCDLCKCSFNGHHFMVDGEIKGTPQTSIPGGESVGQWGYMCSRCFASRGVGIVWGSGQLYQRIGDGDWKLAAGFQPDTNASEGW